MQCTSLFGIVSTVETCSKQEKQTIDRLHFPLPIFRLSKRWQSKAHSAGRFSSLTCFSSTSLVGLWLTHTSKIECDNGRRLFDCRFSWAQNMCCEKTKRNRFFFRFFLLREREGKWKKNNKKKTFDQQHRDRIRYQQSFEIQTERLGKRMANAP